MSRVTRRSLIRSVAVGCPAALFAQTLPHKGKPLDIADYQPQSMLRVPEHRIDKARYPVIDIHTHLSFSKDETNRYSATPSDLLPVMNRRNLQTMVNLTGGRGAGPGEAIQKFEKAQPGRFITFTEPWRSRVEEAGFPQPQADHLYQAVRDLAKGLKV